MINSFSYKEYTEIIENIKKYFKIINYQEAKNLSSYAIIRHDVEFSVQRAYNLALLEKSLGIKSTYFFQIRNNCYNTFSQENINLIKKIYNMGFNIGYHAHMGGLKNIKNIKNYITQDCKIMSKILDININVFSFHRPKKEYLKLNLKFPKLINAYQEEYFTFTEDLNLVNTLYLADSNHQWKWGHPLKVNLSDYKSLQINFHPFSWTKKGFSNLNNYKVLVSERNKEMVNSFNNEINNFPKELL
jgi:hypothetical protein